MGAYLKGLTLIGLGGLLLLARAEEIPAGLDGLDALDRFAESIEGKEGGQILGLAGFHGEPRPTRWLLLSKRVDRGPALQESACEGGSVVGRREVSPLPGDDLPHLPLVRNTLKVGSDETFRIARTRAEARGMEFASVHFHLRVRDEGAEPVWVLHLIARSQVQIGTLYVSASSGEILREAWRGGARIPIGPEKGISSVSAR